MARDNIKSRLSYPQFEQVYPLAYISIKEYYIKIRLNFKGYDNYRKKENTGHIDQCSP